MGFSLVIRSRHQKVCSCFSDELHLTPVHAVVQMRPTFDYLDKADKREKTETAAREAAAAGVYLCITLLVEGPFFIVQGPAVQTADSEDNLSVILWPLSASVQIVTGLQQISQWEGSLFIQRNFISYI